MDDTSFSLRKNAKRAADQMIAKGTAPAVNYGIEPRADGRFEIVWKTAPSAHTAPITETPEAAAPRPAEHEALDEYYRVQAEAAARETDTDEIETEIATATGAAVDEPAASAEPALSEPALITAQPEPDNNWPDGTRLMVRKGKSWSEATITRRLDADHWRVQYPASGSGVFAEADIRAYDAERDARPARQPQRAKATAPRKASRSSYAIDPEAIAAGKLPDKPPVVTSKANPHYQKHFDRLFVLASAGNWDAVRDYEVKGSNSYSKMVARYQQDLLALSAASEAAQ
jgi:hypothetical protein